ncbi:MAG: cardiolipin synthase [Coriobacteriales bacterium]|nr:cardiolipin synthase [Coriobacteriales bacterium]
MRKLLRFITSRGFLTFVLIGLQITLFIWFFMWASLAASIVDWTTRILSYIAVIWIIGRPMSRSYKLIWCVSILVFPAFGGLFYILWGEKAASHPQSKRLARIVKRTDQLMSQEPRAVDELKEQGQGGLSQGRYLYHAGHFPVYDRTATRYLGSGQEKLACLLADIESAERFIFLEYFLIEPGQMWGQVLDALERKAAQGVEVRLMYDDIGCLMRTPRGYEQYLRDKGLKVEPFNRLTPQLTLLTNNRDHRKIVVIDGRVAYTGGINLADEYIDAVRPFGEDCYFKDSGVRLEGDAVWSFTVMFLRNWELCHSQRTKEGPEDYEQFRVDPAVAEGFVSDGYVVPYGDSPLDHEDIGENTYLNLINSAQDTLYMTTPYLIIDDAMTTALCLAAKRGVDVRIVTPHIPDKKPTFLVTRAHYPQLLANGVRVYEYTPGFIHSKLAVADGTVATVGTVNMDYRSFFLHFECGTWMYGSRCVGEVERDIRTIFDQSEELSVQHHYAPKSYLVRVLQALLRVIAPLL